MKRFLLYIAGVMALAWAGNALGYVQEDCVRCHREGSSGSALHLSMQGYDASAHGREIGCVDCHTAVMDQDHETTNGARNVDCLQCHDKQNRHGMKSPVEKRPKCHSCHTAHAVFGKEDERSTVNGKNLAKTCGACHPEESGRTDYLSYMPSLQIASHGKGDLGRAYTRENCLGCHQGAGAHGEVEPINDQDCHRCHVRGDGAPALAGYIHPKADPSANPAIFAAGILYLALAGVLLVGGFAFYVRRLSVKKRGRRE